MTKKTLQNWYYSDDISYSEKERLSKIGVSDYNEYYLQDLKQILRCENWAKENWEIRDRINGKINRIVFFTPSFNDSKPDASNYSCAIVIDGNYKYWAIVYRPSYASSSFIESDLVVKEVPGVSKAESKLNGDYPVSAVVSFPSLYFSYIREKEFNFYDVENNPDKYILPLDIVSRPIDKTKRHFGVYLGNKMVVHFPGGGEPVTFDGWRDFYAPNNTNNKANFSNSIFGFLGSSSGSGSSSSGNIKAYHPIIPFKRKEDIIRHIGKLVNYRYGKYNYSWDSNNCEHVANKCVLGLNISRQVDNLSAIIPIFGDFNDRIRRMLNNEIENEISLQSSEIDGLTLDYSYEEGKVKGCIEKAKNNHSYKRPKYQIEQEKFEERIEVYPKDWCRVS